MVSFLHCCYFAASLVIKLTFLTYNWEKKICIFMVSRPIQIFSSDPKVFIVIQKTNEILSHLRPFVNDFATFIVILFISTLVPGPNRPLFII